MLGNKNVLIIEGVKTLNVWCAVAELQPADSEASAAASLGPSLGWEKALPCPQRRPEK